jgi:hypothetical protein
MEESREVNEVSEQKIEQFYRDATADDVAEIVKTGKAKEARFRDEPQDHWISGSNSFLAGGVISHRQVITWISKTTIRWQCCQVYDPPEILKNKPDPGEGYRLLEKFPPEELQEGDEAWGNYQDNEWGKSDYAERGCRYQSEKLWYRRRIETNNPVIPDSCRSREDIPSGWRLLGKDEERLASDAYWSQGCKEWLLIGDDRVEYANDKTGKWHAIRRMEDFILVEGFTYALPSGKVIRITEKGFEVV